MANGPATRTVLAGSPRLYPTGKAVICLGACSPELVGRRLTIEGRRVQAIAGGRVALLVTYVDQRAYAPPEVERRRHEPSWLASEARLLEQAVERTAVHGRVLPMPLLCLFDHPAALEQWSREQTARFTRGLARLGTKRECAVHLYAGPHLPPGGAPYVARITGRASRNGRAPVLSAAPDVAAHALSVWRAATGLASATRGLPTGGVRGALWSAVVLLEEGEVNALAATINRCSQEGAPLGVMSYVEAPRAPFSFV